MKTFVLFVLIFVGVLPSLYSQEIIPFPDLSEKHIAVYNQKEVFDDHNYSLFTEDYQVELRKIDGEIQVKQTQFESELDPIKQSTIESEIIELNKVRSKLLEEAELVEDLNKFY